MGQPGADEAVVGIQRDLPESLHHSELDPLVLPTAQGALRIGSLGEPLVGAPEHENLDQLLKYNPVEDTSPWAAERKVGSVNGQQDLQLLEDERVVVRWKCGRGAYFFRLGSVENSLDDGTSRAHFSCDLDPH